MIGALQVTCTPPFEKIFSNIGEVTERNGRVALVIDFESMAEAAAFGMLVVPRTDWFVLACHVIAKGGNVDQLRSLAKSVTLESDVTIWAALSAPKEEEESEEE